MFLLSNVHNTVTIMKKGSELSANVYGYAGDLQAASDVYNPAITYTTGLHYIKTIRLIFIPNNKPRRRR